MLGGIIAASVPDAAMHPALRRLSYPSLVISGIAILVKTAALTIVEPEAAPKAADASVVVMASPPGNRETQL